MLLYVFGKLATFIFLSNIIVECNNCDIDWGGEDEMQLESVTFISQLMHSVIQNVDVKIYVV